jgi:hypothetical protein
MRESSCPSVRTGVRPRRERLPIPLSALPPRGRRRVRASRRREGRAGRWKQRAQSRRGRETRPPQARPGERARAHGLGASARRRRARHVREGRESLGAPEPPPRLARSGIGPRQVSRRAHRRCRRRRSPGAISMARRYACAARATTNALRTRSAPSSPPSPHPCARQMRPGPLPSPAQAR